jgi:hypothetical protein
MNDWTAMVFQGDAGGYLSGPETVVFLTLLAFLLGHLVGWVYMWTHSSVSYSQTFVASLVVLPVLVALLMVLMAGSVVIAFGLLAVFAVVRFRNVLKDTRDTTFVIWSILEGMAVGTQRYSTALVGAFGVALVLLYLRITAFGSRHRYDAVLSLQLSGDRAAAAPQLGQVLDRHALRTQLASERRVSNEGLDLSYRLLLRNPARSDELQWELKQLTGVERVSLFLREDESEV